MASGDKLKRFRTHVVKELYETEKDYTSALEFTVTYILEKAKEKGSYDNSFTEERIQILFCNIEKILDFHRSLMSELSACVGHKGPSYDTPIAQVYLKHKDSFELYREYGENNEQAQKLLYELETDDAMKAFFIACMLLGGKGDDDISSYIFKPIQRVCKYPLLFRELVKYTPTEHADYQATTGALDMMRSVCSVINEAKRRVEKLEAIADWQATVEGWEGSDVTDTCNEKIMEGALIKISAGNTQERQFFLFDNLFVYCKKSTILGARKNLLFRGRIPVENLAIENIEDGTSDYYTNGIAVSNSWKVQNVAKNKWFVLIAKSHEQKLNWVDAIKRVKENRKRHRAGLASDTRKLILGKGEKLYHLMTGDHVPKDHKVRLKTYPKSFTGEEFIKWLLVRKEVEKVEEGVILGQALLEHGVIHHVNDRHQFKNNGYVYCFRYDDNTFREKPETADLTAQGVRLYCHLHGMFDPLVRDHRVGLRTTPCVFMSQRLIDWLQSEKDIKRRADGLTLGEQLFAKGMIRHITDEVNFKDGQVLYRFTADDSLEATTGQRKSTITYNPRAEFMHITSQSCRTITFSYEVKQHGYGVELTEEHPVTIKSLSSKAQTYGVSIGDVVLAINGKYISPNSPLQHQGELEPLEGKISPPPLFLTIQKTASQHINLVPTKKGLGFHVKGSSPVVISNVDIDSAASQAGMAISSCILKVGDKEAVTLKHDEVVKEIKSALEVGGAKEKSVSLKLSLPFMEQVSHYCYEGQQGEAMEVYERIVESPYIFDIPAQLMRLYAHELTEMLYILNKAGITDSKIVKYLEDIQKVVGLYKKIHSTLSQPRWPSYKLYGTPQSKFLEACPTNLHTSILSVGVNTDFVPQSPSKGSISERSLSDADDDGSVPDCSRTSYCISTLRIPSVEESCISKEDTVALEDIRSRREMLHDVLDKMREMIADYESIKKMIPDLKRLSATDHSSSNGGTLTVAVDSVQDDLTPAGSPTQSPVLSRRSRTMSVSNPEPVIKLVAEGLMRKAELMAELLDDRLLISILGDAKGIIEPSYEDLLSRFKNRLTVLSGELKACSKRPGEALVKAAKIFVDAIQRHVEELCMHLWISLILCEKTNLMLTVDKLFSQVLTATITGFIQQLNLALRGELNPSADYGDTNSVSSKQWLQLIGKKGVLVHFESTMLPMDESECTALQDLSIVLEKLEKISIVLQATTDSDHPPLPTSDLPPVVLEGNHDTLKVVVYLPPSQYSTLPEEILTSTSGIKVHTVLFNKGLVDLTEGHLAYSKERALNMHGLRAIEGYYKKIRAFRLDKSNLPSDSDEKTLAVNKISIPLNAMNNLFIQLSNAAQEPTRPGVGIITLASELSARMGAVQLNVCDSGVFRSSLTCSLEHVMALCRCHALPFKNFRTALNCMRRHGQQAELRRKNQANVAKCLPKEPPKLYRLPPTENSSQ